MVFKYLRYNTGHSYCLDGYTWLAVKEFSKEHKPYVILRCLGKTFSDEEVERKLHIGYEKIILNEVKRYT